MKDGAKRIDVVVSNAALDDLDYFSRGDCSYFHRFKENRQHFERIASEKYDKGYVEVDGTVCIKAMDLPLIGSD
jgi:hypothetical protein